VNGHAWERNKITVCAVACWPTLHLSAFAVLAAASPEGPSPAEGGAPAVEQVYRACATNTCPATRRTAGAAQRHVVLAIASPRRVAVTPGHAWSTRGRATTGKGYIR
jgi:hypothetical protein